MYTVEKDNYNLLVSTSLLCYFLGGTKSTLEVLTFY